MANNQPCPTFKKFKLCLISKVFFELILTTFIFPSFSDIIISLLLINEDPQGSSNFVILLNK